MPNWVRSKITGLSLEQIEPYKSVSELENEFLDFNKIIPEPNNCDWYPWRIKHWDTKWNSCDCDFFSSEIYISTAWSCPHNIFRRLSKLLNTSFEVVYADEDCGYNTGSFTADNGEILDDYNPEGGSKEAYELYNEAWCEDYPIIQDEDGNWKLDWGDNE